jgi:hypothetical protein
MDRTVLFFITYCKHRSPETDAARAAPAFDNNDIVEIAKAIAHYERFRIFNQKTSGFLPG